MYSLLVAFAAAALSAGFWIDNEIASPLLRFWWIGIVAAYIYVCLRLPESRHPLVTKTGIAVSAAVILLLIVWVFGDLLTTYLAGVVLMVCWGVGCYSAHKRIAPDQYVSRGGILLIALSLALLPVSINRVLVTLPNLSAGTSLSLYQTEDDAPPLDARFYNRLNDKLELKVSLGSQIYFLEPHAAPLLRIDITIPDVVIRLTSIRYEHRLAYLDLPLFEVNGDALMQLEVMDIGAPVTKRIDRVYLLLEQLLVDKPLWLQSPHMTSHSLSAGNQALIIGFRLLLWLICCFAVIFWAPRQQEFAP